MLFGYRHFHYFGYQKYQPPHAELDPASSLSWIPACAGMTTVGY
jgi:hypothetical protein